MRDPKERLRDILDAIAAIERYRDRDRAAFDCDELLQVWFLRHLQIIGEAARALPTKCGSSHWTSRGQRSSACATSSFTATLRIDTDIVWEAVTKDVPALKPAVERLLRKLEETGDDR